jgi:predicted dehydrogenase
MMKLVSIGGFGHAGAVFDEMQGLESARLHGMAPAYAGEDISGFVHHPLCRGVPVFPDWRAMLADIQPDVAIISTRLDLIPGLVIGAAGAGCHIIAEKPLAADLERLAEVRDAVARKGVRLMAMLTMRNEPVFIAAREACRGGAIGDPVLVNARKSYKFGERPDWFGDSRHYSGTMNWVGIHAFDIINFVTGLGFEQVAGRAGNFAHPELPACEDHCAAVARLGNGGLCTVSVDLFRPESAATHGDDWLRVVGTAGILEARACDSTCTVHAQGRPPRAVELPARARIFADFLSAIAGAPAETHEEASLLLTEACIRATRLLKETT